MLNLAEVIRRNGSASTRRDKPFLRFGEIELTHAAFYEECCRYGELFLGLWERGRPFHIGIILDNAPEALFAYGGAWLSGATTVGLDPRGGLERLATEIRQTECRVIVTEPNYLATVEEARSTLPGLRDEALFVARQWEGGKRPPSSGRDLEDALPDPARSRDPGAEPEASALCALLIDGDAKGPPRALRRTHGRMLAEAEAASGTVGLSPADFCYLATPFFQSTALARGFVAALHRGAGIIVSRHFDAASVVDDLRRHRATHFPYVGRMLAAVMSTTPRADDADTPLRSVRGDEPSARTRQEFRTRFGCRSFEVFSPRQGDFELLRHETTPEASAGRPPWFIKVLREDGTECEPAVFDEHGRLQNTALAVGEIVNAEGLGSFEGHWNHPAADRECRRGDMHWTGDFGFRDDAGWLYRTDPSPRRIRVEGELLPALPIEQALESHPLVHLAAVYPVPDVFAAERVMATVVTREDAALDPNELLQFLLFQSDFSPRWLPTYLRWASALPMNASGAIRLERLRHEKFRPDRSDDPIWWRPNGAPTFRAFTEDDWAELRAEFRLGARREALDE